MNSTIRAFGFSLQVNYPDYMIVTNRLRSNKANKDNPTTGYAELQRPLPLTGSLESINCFILSRLANTPHLLFFPPQNIHSPLNKLKHCHSNKLFLRNVALHFSVSVAEKRITNMVYFYFAYLILFCSYRIQVKYRYKFMIKNEGTQRRNFLFPRSLGLPQHPGACLLSFLLLEHLT